ncbi:MAG: amidase family protein, partial [Burkholderiaceae bacterium]
MDATLSKRGAVVGTVVVLSSVLSGCATPGGNEAGGLAAQAAAVRAGTSSSEALVRAAIAKARANTQLNAFITLDEAGALAAAKQIDGKHSAAGPLAGVPIVVKDNIHVAGMPSSAGTP